MLHAVAEDLRWDEPDMAGLLFALCGNHGKALEEGNTTMSSRIRALLDATSSEQERSLVADVQALALRANDLRTRYAVHRMCQQVLHAALSSSIAWYERSLMWALFPDQWRSRCGVWCKLALANQHAPFCLNKRCTECS